MADITYDQTATERKATQGLTAGPGEANNMKYLTSVMEVPPSTSGDTIKFMRIPSNARISNLSRITWDDLSTDATATMDLGLASVNANITSDPDAFSEAHAITAAGNELLLDRFEEAGDYAWDFVNGVTSDPGGELDVYATIVDALTSGLTATVTVELAIYFD